MVHGAEILVWRGQCPGCGERVVSSRQHVCPECGLDEPRQVAALARPAAAPWLQSSSTSRSGVWLGVSGATGTLAIAAGGPALAIALSLGVFLVAAASLMVIAVATRAHHHALDRYQRRLHQRHASALAPQARAITEARTQLEGQISRLVDIRCRIEVAISQRDDDEEARGRLEAIRGTVDTAIRARTMTMTELEAATADIALARWLCKLALLTDELHTVDEVPPRLADTVELEHAARREIRSLSSLAEPARRRQLEERWERALQALAEVRKVLRAEEERLLAVMVRDALAGVQPIKGMGALKPVELPSTIEVPGHGLAALDLLSSRLTGVRDEVQRCLDEEQRLRSELEALVEVERIAPTPTKPLLRPRTRPSMPALAI